MSAKKSKPPYGIIFSQPKVLAYLIAMMCFLVASRYLPIGTRMTARGGQGLDIMVMLDVSQSMLVHDMPDQMHRLDTAKHLIRELMMKFPQARWGLGIFAGEAQGVLPLTDDLDVFMTFLAGVDHRNLARQGTDLGAAIQLGAERFDHSFSGGNILMLLSDGDQEGVALSGGVSDEISLFVVGVGTPQGGPIIEGIDMFGTQVVKQRQGQPVISKLSETSLKQLAHLSQGRYLSRSPTVTSQLVHHWGKIPEKRLPTTLESTEKTLTTFLVAIGLGALLFGTCSQRFVRRQK